LQPQRNGTEVKAPQSKITSEQIRSQLEFLAFAFSITLYPAWRIVVYFIQNVSEPPFSRIGPIVFGLSWLYALKRKPALRKYSNIMTLILALMVTAEYHYLIYRLGIMQNVYSYTNYVIGSVIIVVAYIACMQSLRALYIYSVLCITIGGVTFAAVAMNDHAFFLKVDGGNSALHQLTVVLIVFVITRQRLILDNRLQESVIESQASMVASAKMASLGVMSSGVAHEVNNPLNVIGSTARGLMRELQKDELNRETVLKYADSIEKMTNRIAKIVTGLLEYSRVGQDENKQLETLSLSETIKDAIVLCEQTFIANEISLVLDVAVDSFVRADKVQLEQVFLNILGNAIDAIKISTTKDRRVEVALSQSGTSAVPSFKDSGIAISPDIEARIFDPFFTTKDVGSGTGLGLSISAGIIASLGGTITLKIEPKEFMVSIPIWMQS
jgi:signal transduction histidine kinase